MSSQKMCVILLVLIVGVPFSSAESFGCRDEQNNIVDWFYLYKLPQSLTEVAQKNDGFQFVFTTATQRNNSWTKSTKMINDPASIPGYTVSQIYVPEFQDVALLYNDEPPEGKTDGSRGHTKGVLATNTQQGFWLIHSVPHFPAALENGTYWYPQTGRSYGQSFLCITIGASEVDKVGTQLLYNEPHIYSTSFPESYKTLYPILNRAANMEAIRKAPFWSLKEILSINNIPFKSFAKTRRFRKELYGDWVAPLLSVDLMVESWLHGPGKIDSHCSAQKKVFNIKDISLENVNATFSSLEDHSKWAVDAQSNWICVGDINREEHQKQRGGGTVCHLSSAVARIYKNSIQDFEACPKPK